MRNASLLIFLTSILAVSLLPAASAADGPEMTYPFIPAGDKTLVSSPYFDSSFLDFLEKNMVSAVIDKDGIPLLYYSENGSFGCTGFCSNITMNGYTFGSKMLETTGTSGFRVLDESVVVGSDEVSQSVDTINAIRSGLMDNPEALDEFEKYLLGQEEGYLRDTYYSELYGDVWEQAIGGIKSDPQLYESLRQSIGMRDVEGAVQQLDDYIKNSFDTSGAYDLSNLYSALENGQLGSMQTEEFMKGVLDRLADEQNVDLDLENLDGFSDLLKSDEFKEAMDRASETMKENPEMMDNLGNLAREMLERPETREVFKQALKEAMEKGNWDAIKKLMDVFSKMENKEELMKTLMEGIGEHMMDMVKSGQMDKMMQMMDDPGMRDMASEAFQSFSKNIFEEAWDWAKSTPIELAYIVALAAIIATLVILIRLKM